MIIITGAAGFIGSHLCKKLNFHGIHNLIIVDNFLHEIKRKNWEGLQYVDKIERDIFFRWAEKNVQHIDFIYHLGARTDQYFTKQEVFEQLNVDFSQRIWSFATYNRIPFIYASSYLINITNTLSLYAQSKLVFDQWVEKKQTPPFWAGLKFYQVYGKNEAHKAENSSLVYKIYRKYVENETVFFAEKNILQDYIYVNDVAKVLYYFLNHAPQSGMYEVGTGFARPLQTVVDIMNRTGKREENLMLAFQKEETHVFQADLTNLRKNAYKQPFLTLEQGIRNMFKDFKHKAY